MKGSQLKTTDDYIEEQPTKVRERLETLRTTILKAAPKAEETISYQMPAFKLNGMLVYFAAFKNHIGFYAMPTGHHAFTKELSVYKTGKGSVQFPLDKPLPVRLITKIVKFRVKENLERVKAKKKSI
ncbi:DUF1801 domain-containing protein [soil metagenome]